MKFPPLPDLLLNPAGNATGKSNNEGIVHLGGGRFSGGLLELTTNDGIWLSGWTNDP
jgi:hypothetical protein